MVTILGLGCVVAWDSAFFRYCTSRFAPRAPTWCLPVSGGVALLVSLVMVVVCWCVLILPVLILEGSEIGLGFLDLCLREFHLGENTVHEVFWRSSGDHSRPRVWKRLKLGVSFDGEENDAGRRQLHDHLDLGSLVHDRTGIG